MLRWPFWLLVPTHLSRSPAKSIQGPSVFSMSLEIALMNL